MTFDPVAASINQLRRDLLRARKDIARLQTGAEFTSQFGEDLLAWELLGKKRTGFYVEAGAFDGIRYSVTWALEQLGWGGLLVEPIPEKFEECRINRPRSIVENAALSDHNGTVEMEIVEVAGAQLAGMLSSTKPTNQPHRKVTVPACPLNDLLPKIRIDLLVLDVEGAEVEALRGLDLDTYRPRLMLIEDNDYKGSKDLTDYMVGKPYTEVGRLEVNRMFVHNDEREIFERLQVLTT